MTTETIEVTDPRIVAFLEVHGYKPVEIKQAGFTKKGKRRFAWRFGSDAAATVDMYFTRDAAGLVPARQFMSAYQRTLGFVQRMQDGGAA